MEGNMATMRAYQALDMNALRLLDITTSIASAQFFDNANLTFKGEVYSDVVEIRSTVDGLNLKANIGGSGITVGDNFTLTGGTIEALWVSYEVAPNKFAVAANIAGVSIPALLASQVAASPDPNDNLALVQAVLGGNDNFVGSDFDDVLLSLGGNDIVRGHAGNDVLMGGDGDDKIYGGDGNDVIVGGQGLDRLYGDAGADIFAFGLNDSPLHAIDRIGDFVAGFDKIDLATVGAGGLAASAFAAVSVASDNFNRATAAATAAMAGGDKSAVFVAGVTNGWLFWNTDSNPQTPDQSVRLDGFNSVSAFQSTDVI